MTPHLIRCGHCGDTHGTVGTVRACHDGRLLGPCDWLVRAGRTEDGDEIIIECRAPMTADADGRGYGCEHGHTHVHCEVRAAEGWDYASDAEEARHMRANGLDAVGPDGGSI